MLNDSVDPQNYLKHKRKEMNGEDLVVRLRTGEDIKIAQNKSYVPTSTKANVVETRQSSKGNKKKVKIEKKGKGKSSNLVSKCGILKNKFQRT